MKKQESVGTFSLSFKSKRMRQVVFIVDADPVWPDLAKFRHYGKNFQVFGNFLPVYFLFGKIVNLLW